MVQGLRGKIQEVRKKPREIKDIEKLGDGGVRAIYVEPIEVEVEEKVHEKVPK